MKILPITVKANLPERLKPLQEMANNIWFCWKSEAIRMFQQLNSELWEEVDHNPKKLVGMLDQARIDEILSDEGILDQMDRLYRDYQRYVQDKTQYTYNLERPADYTIAYLSCEYGLTECLPVYSGGLGLLSGDHLKSASDIRLPLIGVGLLYKEGYFRQYLNADGYQQESYPDNDFPDLPMEQCLDEKGKPVSVEVQIEGRRVVLEVWKVMVGRVALYLMDANLTVNAPQDRVITCQLYGGDREMRIKQEIVLGIGGVRMLGKLGIQPAVYHMNEGHSAFCNLERMVNLVKLGLSYDAAKEYVKATSVFTTHTAVPAGNDVFVPELFTRFFGPVAGALGISMDELLGLGRVNPADKSENFCMTVLAMKTATWINGVSKIHARVSREMWTRLWPDLPVEDLPIQALTNGVHIPSWISYEMGLLYDRYLGHRWSEEPDSEKVWQKVEKIPDTELWRTHERRRERLVAFARRQLEKQLQRHGAPQGDIAAARNVLLPQALTIGFSRRFATYKRALLIFRDTDRLDRILNNPDRPVQLLIAGKAHPQDSQGKEFIKRIIQIAREPRFRQRIVFIENYDIYVARYMVQGCDVWLNNPRRPLEACGTSGMKAAANGALNLSILDGWWDEAYNGSNGWAIGSGDEYSDEKYQDEIESRMIYDLLERDLVPMFYDRSGGGLPERWIKFMKENLKTICPVFNTHRMVEDYMERFYHPAANMAVKLGADNFAGARDLARWRQHVNEVWNQIQVKDISVTPGMASVNGTVSVRAVVATAGLKPEELSVEAYYGKLNVEGKFTDKATMALKPSGQEGGATVYTGDLSCTVTGRVGVAVRVLPQNAILANPLHAGLVKWG